MLTAALRSDLKEAYRNVCCNGWASEVWWFAISIYRSWFVVADCVLWLQYLIPRLCAKFGDIAITFDKVSPRSSYAKQGCVYQESENMLNSRFEWTRLGVSYFSWSENPSTRSLVLNHITMPCLQHAKGGDTLRLLCCPSEILSKLASWISTIISNAIQLRFIWRSWHGINLSRENIGAQAFVQKIWSAFLIVMSVWSQDENKLQITNDKKIHMINYWISHKVFLTEHRAKQDMYSTWFYQK